jgi:Tfp pilus assembly pilus retraction ATPase PilT
MELHEILAYATKSRVAELRFEVGKTIELLVDGKMKLLNLPPLDAKGFDELVVENLSAPARETLRTTGQCEESIEVEGLGQFRALVEGGKARIILPVATLPANGTSSSAASDRGPGAVPTFSERLRDLFGRKK